MGSLRGRRGCVCDGGSVRRSSEAEVGLVAWIEGREERLGLRENEEKKKRSGGRGRGVGVRERVTQKRKKNEGKPVEISMKRESGWEGK